MSEKKVNHRPLRAKLIFNAVSGRSDESPTQLADILTEMQNWNILSEVYMVHPDSQIESVVRSAIKGGTNLIVVAGGDGTIDSVVGAMIGSSATLGIIPTGTRNNLAFNLGVPSTIAGAVALLREGRRLKVDVGKIQHGRSSRWFLEDATLGLLSDIYPFADGIQHGDLTQIGNLLSTVVSSTPSQLRMILEGRKKVSISAYMVLIANMPYIGPRFQISPDVFWNDNHLDVFVFSDMSKLDLISYAVQSTSGAVEDARIKHYHVKRLTIRSDPPMPVLADGIPLDQGSVTASVHPRALAIMGGAANTAMGEKSAT
ncbi:MAG: diacylglycerol kinase family protein [Anaerolineales bacterium]|jgi:diacylglycerol kinase family enzyme|nr:diacylglycerol kinase family protein [Anaerolineales bacterium]